MKITQLFASLFSLCLLFTIATTTVAQDAPQGDLFLVETEYVSPENFADYTTWGIEFKKIADETGFKDFFVDSDIESVSYIWNVGKDLAGVDKFGEDFDKWQKANPKVGELYEKYHQTVTYRSRELWRHDTKHSYQPVGYKPSGENTYSRLFFGYVKTGKGKAVGTLLDEYHKLWSDKSIETPYAIYWNVMGLEQNCFVVVESYKDLQHWVDDRKTTEQKIGMEKLGELEAKWIGLLRKMEMKENYPRLDLSHFNLPAVEAEEKSAGNKD